MRYEELSVEGLDFKVYQLKPNSVFNGYEILNTINGHRLGESLVYRARNLNTGKTCALKQLLDYRSPVSLRRFRREFNIMRSLCHERIVKAREIFEDKDTCPAQYFIAMEYIPGDTLDESLKLTGVLSQVELLKHGISLTETFLHLQSRGLVYRDGKPGNLIHSPQGKWVLIDFGASARVGTGESVERLGTPGYTGPECFDGMASSFSDTYSVAAILYYCATGDEQSILDYFRIVSSNGRTRPHLKPMVDANPTVSEPLDNLIGRCLSPSPLERPSLSEFREGLVNISKACSQQSRVIKANNPIKNKKTHWGKKLLRLLG